MVCAHPEFFGIASQRARKSIEKRGIGPSKIEPGRSKIGPGATQHAKKTTQEEQQTPNILPKAGRERKKGAQERKMCQHGPNLQDFGLNCRGADPH